MIEILEGVVGGGKTIYAVKRTMLKLLEGGTVYTNVDMDRQQCKAFAKRKGVYLQRDQLNQLPEVEDVKQWWSFIEWGALDCPVLVIIDEAHLFYNSRDHRETAKAQRDMLSFLSQSRKAGIDVLFIAQDVRNLDSQFMRLAEIVILARNMKQTALPGLGIKLSGLLHYDFYDTKAGTRLRHEWWRGYKSHFGLYRTEAFLDSLMRSLAETKKRIQRRALERVPPPVRLVHVLRKGDRIEKWLASKLLPFAVTSLKKQRRLKHNESDNNNSVRARVDWLRGLSNIHVHGPGHEGRESNDDREDRERIGGIVDVERIGESAGARLGSRDTFQDDRLGNGTAQARGNAEAYRRGEGGTGGEN